MLPPPDSNVNRIPPERLSRSDPGSWPTPPRLIRTGSDQAPLTLGVRHEWPGGLKAGSMLDLSNAHTYNAPGIKGGSQRDGSSRCVTQEREVCFARKITLIFLGREVRP